MTLQLTQAMLTGSAIAAGTGLHTASWGAFKDSPYEGFHPARMARTLVVGQLAAWTAVATHLVDATAVIPTAGVVYTMERLATEFWKTILRRHDAAAFTIPMRLGFRGRPVDTPWRRYSAGALVLLAMVGVGLAMHLIQTAAPAVPWWVTVVFVGGFGGWATAVGGAWKDAPIEGFSGWKFLRSPLMATAWAVPCSVLTTDWVTLCLASGGFAVATIETYKTFMTGDKAPGKFAGRERDHALPGTRTLLAMLHASAWALLSVAALWSALGALVARPSSAPTHASTTLATLAVGVIAAAAAHVTLRARRPTTLAGPANADVEVLDASQ